jgi:hypothetical protein
MAWICLILWLLCAPAAAILAPCSATATLGLLLLLLLMSGEIAEASRIGRFAQLRSCRHWILFL